MVKQIVVVACVLVAGCAPIGHTCGRGRCPDDTECVSIFADFNPDNPDENNSQLSKQMRNIYWCAREQTSCASGTELVSPTDWDDVVCELPPGESVDIEITFPRTVPEYETCDPVSIDSVQWVDNTYDTSSDRPVLLASGTSVACSTGFCELTAVAGDWVPGTLWLFIAGRLEYVYQLPPFELTTQETTGESRSAFQLSSHLAESRAIHLNLESFACYQST